MTLLPDHPDDIAERWSQRYAASETPAEATEVNDRALLAGLDARLCARLYREQLARLNALEALYEAIG